MDSGLITERRTGAATAIAAKWLTRDEPVTLSVIGCGVQGRIQLRCVALVLR
jgi:alanine dehydrogenase